MKNGTITEQIRMQERVNELTHSLQHDGMNSVIQACKQSVMPKRQEEIVQNKGLRR